MLRSAVGELINVKTGLTALLFCVLVLPVMAQQPPVPAKVESPTVTALTGLTASAHSIASTVNIRRGAKEDAFRYFMTPPKRQPTEGPLRPGRAHVGPKGGATVGPDP